MPRTKNFFRQSPDDLPPLPARARRRIRFEEVDMLGIVWHGHYVSYLEDGRIAFGDKYGLSYAAMRDNRIAAPIVTLHLDYMAPLYFDQEVEIEAILHWCDALRLNFEYRLSCEGRLVCRGYTVQLLMDLKKNVLLVPPEFVTVFRTRWRQGEFP